MLSYGVWVSLPQPPPSCNAVYVNSGLPTKCLLGEWWDCRDGIGKSRGHRCRSEALRPGAGGSR